MVMETIWHVTVKFMACSGFALWVMVGITASVMIHRPGIPKARPLDRKGKA